MTPKVSIAIPAYKSTFLRQAIESVLRQTFFDWELIIVNDASPEPISDIMKDYKDPRIRYYINESNIGKKDPTANWNKCLSFAQGDFFSLLCDDDTYEPEFIQTMLSLTYRYPECSVFRARAKIVDKQNNVINYYPSSPEWEPCEEYMWHIFKELRFQTISEFFYRTDYIKKKGGYVSLPKAWCADLLSIFYFSKECGIVSDRNILVTFRNSGLNISTKSKYIREKVIAQNEFTEKIEKFVNDSSFLLKETLIELKRNDKRIKLYGYLEKSSYKEFLYLFIHRNADPYKIPTRYFIRTLHHWFIRKIKNIFNYDKT